MNKCDWCSRSVNKDGKIVCPYEGCILTSSEITKIMENLSKIFK